MYLMRAESSEAYSVNMEWNWAEFFLAISVCRRIGEESPPLWREVCDNMFSF
jgi:hypothetical protein